MRRALSRLSMLLVALLASCTSSSIVPSSSMTTSTTTSTPTSSLVTSTTTSTATSVTTSVATSSSSSEATSASSIPDNYPFVPGHLGPLPTVTGLEPVAGQFAGLYIEQEDRHDDFMGGTKAESLLKFPEPWQVNALTFQLQYYNAGSAAWENYGTGDDYVTNYDNFVVPSVDGQRMRLLAVGGAGDGLVSNEVTLSYASLDTAFTGYSLDESMSLTGVIWPFSGRGLQASFTVTDLETDAIVEDALIYQWHRVHPYTFAHTPIPGATELTYVTTIADLGYYIAIVATGDGVNASGSFEVISDVAPVKLPVKAFATDITTSSFVLRFEYVLSEFSFDYLGIDDEAYTQVVASSVTLGIDGTYATVTLMEPTTSTELYVSYQGGYWSLVEHEFGMHPLTVTIVA